jgi:hypothetical protein
VTLGRASATLEPNRPIRGRLFDGVPSGQ